MPHGSFSGDSLGFAAGSSAIKGEFTSGRDIMPALLGGVRQHLNGVRSLISNCSRIVRDATAALAPAPWTSAVAEPLEYRRLLSATYFVAPNGSDSNPGTIGKPFQTIQHAASIAGPGTTVEIRGGTYRETVTPTHSGTASAPITFTAFQGENVIIDGANTVTGWTHYKGSIYKANDPTDLGFGKNQIFVDGQAMNEARWPNTSLNLSHPHLAIAQGGGGGGLTDSALASSGVNWTGATIHIISGAGWVSQTGTIRSDSGNHISFSLGFNVAKNAGIRAGNAFYLTGKFQALDAAGEWFRDGSGALYLWDSSGDNPGGHHVEAKARQFGFNISHKNFINISGIHFFACSISAHNSNGIHINNITDDYVSQFVLAPNGWQAPLGQNIELYGNGNSFTNSVVAYSAGDGVMLYGHNNVMRNNVIHDCDLSATDSAGINAWGSGDVIDHNTIYNCARDGIKFSNTLSTQITNNLIHDVALQTSDCGAVYTYGTNGAGSVISGNRCYNIHSGGWGAAGLYLDNGSHNFYLHNNDVYNVDIGLKANPTSLNETVINNTLIATQFSVGSSGSANMSGSHFIHNVMNNKTDIKGSVSIVGNMRGGDTSGVKVTGAFVTDVLPSFVS